MSMCDALGRDVFRRHWGGTFTRADGQHVYHGNRGPYEARPLIAAAYSCATLKPHPYSRKILPVQMPTSICRTKDLI